MRPCFFTFEKVRIVLLLYKPFINLKGKEIHAPFTNFPVQNFILVFIDRFHIFRLLRVILKIIMYICIH